jgi:bacterial leucyl aminopeptidase
MRLLLSIAMLLGLSTTGNASTIEITKNSVTQKSSQMIIYQNDDVKVITDKLTTSSDLENLYVVLTPKKQTLSNSLTTLGEVIAFQPNHIAIMRISDKNIAKVSGYLHDQGLACGVLEILTNRPVHQQQVATPVALIPVAARDARVTTLADQVVAANIKTNVEMLSAMETRYHNSDLGRSVAGLLGQKYAELSNGRADVTISSYEHSRTTQDSLVVRIEGTERPNEVIILGSHIDSINSWSDSAPGADDNASGTATNIEIFRVMMENNIHPKRTLEIHGYAAEEIGLVGSKEIAAAYRSNNVNVIAMMQIDMNLYNGGVANKIWFVSNSTNSGFNGQLATLSGHYSGLPNSSGSLSGGSSDHASWNREGYAVAFPFENPSKYNRSIHSSSDTISNSGAFDQAAGFAKLGLSYIAHFGGL